MQINPIADERLKILRFTQQKFLNEGFYKTTIEEIASELAISKNTIYKYFPTKDNLINEVFTDFIKNVSSSIEAVVKADENAVQKFVNLVQILTSKQLPISERLMKDMHVHAPQLWENIDKTRKQLMSGKLGRLIEQGKKEELFISYPTDIILMVFISSLRSVVNPEFLMNTKLSKNDAIRNTFHILLNGILTKKGLQIFKKLKLPQ